MVSLLVFLFLFQISLQSLWVTFLVLDTTGFYASRFLFLPIVQEVSFLGNRLHGSMGNSFLFVGTVVSLTKCNRNSAPVCLCIWLITIYLSMPACCNLIGICCSGFFGGCIQVVSSGMLNGYVFRVLEAWTIFYVGVSVPLGFNPCLYRGKWKWNEAYPPKVVPACLRLQLTFWFS